MQADIFLAPQLHAAFKRFNIHMVVFCPWSRVSFMWGIKDGDKMRDLYSYGTICKTVTHRLHTDNHTIKG